jgi:hypothetical protein
VTSIRRRFHRVAQASRPTSKCTGPFHSSRLLLSQKPRRVFTAGDLRRWAANQVSRITRIAPLVVLLGTASAFGHSQELLLDEAIVLVKYKNQDRSVDVFSAHLIFSSLDSNKPIRVQLNDKLQKFVVTAGSYYLKRVETGFSNIVLPDRPRPKQKDGVIEVPAGSVVYIGDYGFDKKFAFHIEFKKDSLLEATDMKLPEKLPIYLSRAGHAPQRLRLK